MMTASEQTRQWRLKNPDKYREHVRRAREKRNASPEALAASRELHRNWMRAARARNPEKYLEYRREYGSREGVKQRSLALQRRSRHKRQYGLTLEQRTEMLEAQGKCCAICKSPGPVGYSGWRMDHCHASGKIRGLLCNHCNLMLGYAKDNPEILTSAVGYLNHYSASNPCQK